MAENRWLTTTYLCGGINGLSDADCRDWREIAKARLQTETLDPMRRDYRGREAEHMVAIVEGDLDDLRHACYMLINATRPSWGTAMEVHQGYLWGKVMVAFTGDAPVSPWVRFHVHGHVVRTVEEACDDINAEYAKRQRTMRRAVA